MHRTRFGNRATLYHGDCRDVSQRIKPQLAHAVVCDPPYGLGFMGKGWDHGVPGVEFWRAIHGTLRPGGYLLAFGGTRTWHRLAVAIEDAGFELRDTCMWMYGSGFPKSHDVSKAIDKMHGAERITCRVPAQRVRNPKSIRSGHGVEGGDRPWMQEALRNGYHEAVGNEPMTDDAKQWHGWGTALKPAWEPIIMAQRPFKGTVARNTLTFGTGGLNIDGCRVNTGKQPTACKAPGWDAVNKKNSEQGYRYSDYRQGDAEYVPSTKGRWPANVLLDHHPECKRVGKDKEREHWACVPECPVRQLDDHAGEKGGGFGRNGDGSNTVRRPMDYAMKATGQVVGYGDHGGPSRFFYCGKASKKDRNYGGVHNTHVTVKPHHLMRYLVRLVTPPNGIVYDPFMGSGSTGRAAIAEGMRFIGVDKSKEAYEIACRRVGRQVQLTPA